MKSWPASGICSPRLSHLKSFTRPWGTLAVLVLTDFLALAIATNISVWGRLWWGGSFEIEFYLRLWPLLFIFVMVYGLQGLYPGVIAGPVDELRSLTVSTSLIYFFLGAIIFLFREGTQYSRAAFLIAWVLSIIFVLLGRMIVRGCCAHRSWWGFPAIVLGAGQTGEMVIETLHRHPTLGLKPVALFDDDPQKRGSVSGVPIVGELSLAPRLAQRLKIPYAIVAMPGVESDRLRHLIEQYGQVFPHLLVIPNLFGMSSLWVVARDLSGVLGLEIRQQLLLPGPRIAKRLVDLGLAVVLSILLIPFIACIALLIGLDSRGGIFYGHTRLGRGGKPFKAWKFRTMVANADAVLEAYLATHPEERRCWYENRKLKQDPRITTIGKILRRTSLDELPQLWNVLRQEMSLVGPRPIVQAEVVHYAEKFQLYTRVLPGITGLWQVSGRSNTTYEERVNLDAYYVRNWSVWLDLHILLKTIGVVLRGDGAY